ncbi:MAG TPA: S9 family peptidase [Blastocatellia bacterium]|nr:S9 family peptidase [Blastocatellia bacterium]
MHSVKVAPFGSWRSPITSDLIVSGTVGLNDVALDGGEIYWVESRPSEAGRNVIVRLASKGQIKDITPPRFNARTRAHEYGGGAYVVLEGTIYFSNFADQKLYRQPQGEDPEPLTTAADFHYADAVIDARRRRLICVREDHTAHNRDCINSIAAIDLAGSASGETLISGNDFYSSPRLSPDGKRLAWLTWNHPNMPWDGTELWVAAINEDGSIGESRPVAGGPQESIAQPEWSPDGVLHFVSDRSGWWNLYRLREDRVEPLCEMEAEFAAPQWVFRMSYYGFESERRIICAYNVRGLWHLASLDTRTGALERIETAYTQISNVRVSPGRVTFCGGSPVAPTSVVSLDLATGRAEVLRRSSSIEMDEGYLSVPQPLEFPTESGLTAHGFFYAPKNRDFSGPAGELPPLIVISHGGPTSAATTSLNLNIQYWTSRGIAVLDVNYGGSTGFGRAYRERLNGEWGVLDVDDCVNGARHLAERGLVDGDRLIIRGGSAGGYTTLAALTFRDVFKAGASYYGISDLEALEQDCHKFESRYNHTLIGPYPEQRDLYRARSPIHFTARLSCPLIIFQGLEDRIVPPNQAEMMYEAVRAKGLPVAYIPFEGEQHGFRKAENIKRALDGELYFYSKVFGFDADVQPDPSITERFENF